MGAYFAMFVSEFVFTSVNYHRCVDLKNQTKRFPFIVHVDVLENMHTCIYKSKADTNYHNKLSTCQKLTPFLTPLFLHAGTRVCALIPGLTIGGQRRKGWRLWSTIYSTATMTTGWESKQFLKLIKILKGDGVKR